jgi:hypothetical protein
MVYPSVGNGTIHPGSLINIRCRMAALYNELAEPETPGSFPVSPIRSPHTTGTSPSATPSTGSRAGSTKRPSCDDPLQLLLEGRQEKFGPVPPDVIDGAQVPLPIADHLEEHLLASLQGDVQRGRCSETTRSCLLLQWHKGNELYI